MSVLQITLIVSQCHCGWSTDSTLAVAGASRVVNVALRIMKEP